MTKQQESPEIPRPAAFRAWLVDALDTTDLKPATIARAIGASVNSVGAFLRDPSRDITLSRAAEIERYVRRAAKDQGKELPAIRHIVAVPLVA